MRVRYLDPELRRVQQRLQQRADMHARGIVSPLTDRVRGFLSLSSSLLPPINYHVLSAAGVGSGDGITASVTVDSTGAKLIVIGYSHFDDGINHPPITLIDSRGNALIAAAAQPGFDSSFDQAVALAYTIPTSTGAGHTITVRAADSVSNVRPTVHVLLVGGTTPTGAVVDASTPGYTGGYANAPIPSSTPTDDNALMVCIGADQGAGVTLINSGFSVGSTVAYAGSNNGSSGMFYLIQTTKTAEAPTPSFADAACLATFLRGNQRVPWPQSL